MADPKTNLDAIASRDAKRAMPTTLGSRELQRLSREIRERSHFSAKTPNETLLRRQMEVFRQLLEPQRQVVGEEHITDPAAARLALKEMLRDIGYEPGTTGPVGTVQDLASDSRIDLIIRTNTEMALGAGKLARDQATLDEFPAQELWRLEAKEQQRSWFDRWRMAGSASGRPYGSGWGIYQGRMIALKNHPIWLKLGDSTLFDDGLGNPYPPFAWNSGMWIQDVSLAEALDLGVMQPGDDTPAPANVFNNEKVSNSIGQPRDHLGRWVDMNGGGLEDRDNIARGMRAVRRYIRSPSDVEKSMWKQGVGQIDFDHGTPGRREQNRQGTDREGGWGLSHISAKRGAENLRRLPYAVALGKVKPHDSDSEKRFIEHGDSVVVIKRKADKLWRVETHIFPAETKKGHWAVKLSGNRRQVGR